MLLCWLRESQPFAVSAIFKSGKTYRLQHCVPPPSRPAERVCTPCCAATQQIVAVHGIPQQNFHLNIPGDLFGGCELSTVNSIQQKRLGAQTRSHGKGVKPASESKESSQSEPGKSYQGLGKLC